ncbi:MAG: hypothetical protein ACYCV7_16830, partial [Acidimicrobiales bacterium]
MSVALEALGEVHDATSTGVIAAVVALAGPGIGAEARAVLERLHAEGVHSPLEEAIGTLEAQEAYRVGLGGAEVLVVVLRRPGGSDVQVGLVIIDHEAGNGAAVSGSISPPGHRSSFDELLQQISDDIRAEPERITIAELVESLGRALARTAEIEMAVDFDLGIAMPILSRALTGDPASFAPVTVNG